MTAAWLAVVPTTAIVLAAMLKLGPSVGTSLLPKPTLHFWADQQPTVHPEPTEQARYLIALSAPLVHGALTPLLARLPRRRLQTPLAALALLVESVLVLAASACFVVQWRYPSPVLGTVVHYFSARTLIVGAALALAMLAGVRSARVRSRVGAWAVESRRARRVAGALALVAIAIELLPALQTEGSIGHAYEAVSFHLQFTFDETAAVRDGHSPLGDFATQYSALWPYVVAAAMSVLGHTVGVFTGCMAALLAASWLALYDMLRRIVRSALLALGLFLPLLATSAFRLHGPNVERFSLVDYFGVLPLRYAGPLLLAWLTVRHLDGERPHRTWPLFLLGGLVVMNNTDFGVAALGATVAALLWTGGRARELAVDALLGLAAAVALVVALLLIRTGSPPHFGLLFRYANVFVVNGYAMLPIRPLVGVYLVLFATYAVAIGVATTRAIRGEPDRLLTGLLVWCGVFGLGSGSYYVGHSLPELLIYLFPTWGLTVALLAVIALRRIAARAQRWPTPGELAVLVGLGVLACSLAQTPAPWSQLQRLRRDGPAVFARPPGYAFLARHTRAHEPVAALMTLGHSMSASLRLDDVTPYTGSFSILTREQLAQTLRALRAAGGRKVILLEREVGGDLLEHLARSGYAMRARGRGGAQLWVER